MAAKLNIKAGAAAIDITPLNYRDTYLAGFQPNRRATGVLDPICARALYLEDDNTHLLIVACDLIGMLQPYTESVRRAIDGVNPDHVFLCSTHTHSGPDTLGLWGPALGEIPYASGISPYYMRFLQQQIVTVALRAKRRALPAEVFFGEDRSRKEDLTWNIRQAGYMDHALTVMRVDREDGLGTIATLVNYASHPETLWSQNTRISPDYPAMIHRKLETKLGGVSIFVSGALGGMVTPGIAEDAALAERETFYRSYGNKLAKMALDCAKSAEKENNPALTVRSLKVKLPLQNRHFVAAAGMGLVERSMAKGKVDTEVGHIRIGGATIATTPGELTPAVGLRIKSTMSGSPRFLFCLCNDEIGYVLDASVYADDLFQYERSMSVGPKTGELLVKTYASMDG